MVTYQKIKDIGFFTVKVALVIFLWRPLFIIGGVLTLVGAFRLFALGPSVRYPQTLKDKMSLEPGDIVLFGKQSVFHSFAIQLSNVLTRSIKHRFWAHAAIYKGDGKLIEAQPEGIIERNIDDYFSHGYYVRAFRHRYIRNEEILERVIQQCQEKHGKPYGWLGLGFFTLASFMPISLNFLFDNWIVDKLCRFDDKYFCSELIVDAFDEAGYPISPFDGWRVKPTDFINNPLLEPVTP